MSAGLTPFKLATIVVLTSEVIRNSNAEAVVRQALLNSVAGSLDAALFGNDAATPELRPAGLLYDIEALEPSDATDKFAAMANDISALITSVAWIAGNSNVTLIAAPAQAVRLLMAPARPYLVLMSASLPDKTVVAVANDAVASVAELPSIDASRDSVVHMNDAPAQLNTGTPAPPTYSMYQTDSVSLRLRWPVSWALRDPRALAWMQDVTW